MSMNPHIPETHLCTPCPRIHTSRRPTYAYHVHESIHPVADLEEEVLALPFCWGAEGWPDEPRDAGDEEEGTQDGSCDLNLLDDCQGDGLPLQGWERRVSGGLQALIPFPPHPTPSSCCCPSLSPLDLNQGSPTCDMAALSESFWVLTLCFWYGRNPYITPNDQKSFLGGRGWEGKSLWLIMMQTENWEGESGNAACRWCSRSPEYSFLSNTLFSH